MELHQIRYFLALSEELNFTRAAQRCRVAQSSLTRAIRALESELGGTLFHRERANSHLSKLGQTVHPHLAQAYSHVEAAKRRAREFLRRETRTLRLGVMSTIAPRRVVALLDAVQGHGAAGALQAVSEAATTLQEQLVSGALDAAIYALPGLAADARLHPLPLYRERFVIVVSERHRLARRGAVRAAELAGEPLLWRQHCEHEAEARAALAQHGCDVPPAFASERDDWILALVAAGHGVALMPALSASDPGVTALRLIEPELARDIALVTVRGRPDTPALGWLVHEIMRLGWAEAASEDAPGTVETPALARTAHEGLATARPTNGAR